MEVREKEAYKGIICGMIFGVPLTLILAEYAVISEETVWQILFLPVTLGSILLGAVMCFCVWLVNLKPRKEKP